MKSYPIIEFNSEPESITKNQYIVKLTFSHGDADFETKEYFSFDKLGNVSLFVHLCKKLQELINDKRSYGVDYDVINKCILENTNWTLKEGNYSQVFEDEKADSETLIYLFNGLDFWILDKVYLDTLAALYEIEVFYYDSQGLEFKGKV